MWRKAKLSSLHSSALAPLLLAASWSRSLVLQNQLTVNATAKMHRRAGAKMHQRARAEGPVRGGFLRLAIRLGGYRPAELRRRRPERAAYFV